jgi:chemotaxis signal transduction protein
MVDIIIFTIKENLFALNLEYTNRIIHIPEVTSVPSSHTAVDGMLSYEGEILKVVNLRKLLEVQSYENELSELFSALIIQHKTWLNELENAINGNTHFSGIVNPHLCELGKWLDKFNSYDDKVSKVLKTLISNHTQLHNSATDVMELLQKSQDDAKESFKKEIAPLYSRTMGSLDSLQNEFTYVANSLQKLLIYTNGVDKFTIKIDSIIDIIHIDESEITKEKSDVNSEHIEFSGVLKKDDKLINVISAIHLPKK